MNKRSGIVKLFSVGPVQMYTETKQIASQQLPYFRDEDFSNMMLKMERQLKQILHVKEGRAIFLTGSGTSAMESLVACSLRKENRVLIINGGSFGERFTKLCACYGIPYDEIKLPFPETLSEEKLNQIDGSCYDALLVNLHETSTGQLYSLEWISAYAKKYHLSLMVDAISSFLSDPLDMETYGIDALILSSQKALACAPGISMIVMKEQFYQSKIIAKTDICMYLSIKEHVKNMERGQTPNTPAVGVLLELSQMLDHITQIGVDVLQKQIQRRAQYFREHIQTLPVMLPPFPLSNALTPLLFINHDAQMVYQQLKKRYQIYLTPSGGAMKTKMLRVGHLGDVSIQDYDELIACLKEVLI